MRGLCGSCVTSRGAVCVVLRTRGVLGTSELVQHHQAACICNSHGSGLHLSSRLGTGQGYGYQQHTIYGAYCDDTNIACFLMHLLQSV